MDKTSNRKARTGRTPHRTTLVRTLCTLVAALAMAFALAACAGGSNSGSGGNTTSSGTATDASNASYRIGICQLVQHEALDAATQGFKDAIDEALPGQVSFDEQNASGEVTNCTTIVNGFVSSNVDLILANATSPLQAAAAATDTIPVLGTSITDYATALEISDWTGTVGTNVSGTSDLAPLDEQANMVKEWFPDATTVGLLYCSAEANSQYQVDEISTYLRELGYECKPFSFTDTNDVASVAQSACAECDVIYIPTDNVAAANTEAIANVVLAAGVPVVAGEQGICSGCGVCTLSISYYELGRATGEQAVRILTGQEDVSSMPVAYAPTVTKMYNEANVAALGLDVPQGYEPIVAE